MTLSLAEASSIVDAAIIKARQLDVTVCVAVCDRLGFLIALNRMDGAYETINRYSVGKAVVSAGTGLPSGDVVGIVDHPPVGTAVAEGFPAIRIRGGLPIRRGGAVEGGCGVAGALSPEQDEECARAGIAAFNATTTVNERSSVATLASAPKTASAQESSMTDREIRAALNQHWAASDANDFELEHQIYREDAVLEYPQSGERIRGRGNIQITRTLQPSKKRFKVRRVIGRGDLWVSEYVILYDGQPSYTVSIMEFEGGKVARETQYFGDPFEASAWRARWVEPMEKEQSVR
jgi:uncharacterized protein GlcG (DUF336 family)/ketosteroid isomerase-like protein